LRLDPSFRVVFYAILSLLFATGALWLLADDAASQPGSETWPAIATLLLTLHGSLAMLTLLALGALLAVHVFPSWQKKRNLATGVGLLVVNALLVITACGLYYIGGEALRRAASNVHLALGFLLPLLATVHVVRGRQARKRAEACGVGPEATEAPKGHPQGGHPCAKR
jgi:hypothetical protein